MIPKSILEPFRSSHVPEITDLLSALQLLNLPAVLVYNPKEWIVGGNTAFNQLTGFGPNELTGKPIQVLFPAKVKLSELASRTCELKLKNKSAETTPVEANLWQLDLEHYWSILSFRGKLQQTDVHDLFPEALKLLSSMYSRESGVIVWIKDNLSNLAKLLDETLFDLYIHDHEMNEMIKIASADDTKQFLLQFPESDLKQLIGISIWEPGKRVLTEVHRQARIKNMAHVMTAPIHLDDQIYGVLLAGSIDKKPSPILADFVHLFNIMIRRELMHEARQSQTQEILSKNDAAIGIYSEAFENSKEGICLLDPSLSILHMNSAAEWMLGYADWEVKDHTVENVLIGPKNLSGILADAQAGVTTPNLGECTLHHRDGHTFPVQLRIIPIVKEQTVKAILVFFRDITEQEQIIARTQQLEHRALLGDVTSIFAHEVRNPINNISTGLQLLSARLDPADPNREVINRMEVDCTRLNELMESVLAFSRPVDQKFEAVDLATMLQRLIDRWRPRLSKLNIEPFFHSEVSTPVVNGNVRSLEQVFINLISNAADAMARQGGTLAVKIVKGPMIAGNSHVDILVSDNGPGIPDEVKKRLFEPFVTNKPHGTGLGLAITKKIVSAHHGNIEVESYAGGTIFHVIIPSSNGAA